MIVTNDESIVGFLKYLVHGIFTDNDFISGFHIE